MTTDKTFLFFPATEYSEPFYKSISDILSDGNPIDDMGNDISPDGKLYYKDLKGNFHLLPQ